MIEQLESDKLNLIAELDKSNHQATEAIELKEMAEKEAAYFKTIVRAIETDKQKLQQEVQTLTGVVEHFKSTTVKSLDQFRNKLKLDLHLFASKPWVEDYK